RALELPGILKSFLSPRMSPHGGNIFPSTRRRITSKGSSQKHNRETACLARNCFGVIWSIYADYFRVTNRNGVRHCWLLLKKHFPALVFYGCADTIKSRRPFRTLVRCKPAGGDRPKTAPRRGHLRNTRSRKLKLKCETWSMKKLVGKRALGGSI